MNRRLAAALAVLVPEFLFAPVCPYLDHHPLLAPHNPLPSTPTVSSAVDAMVSTAMMAATPRPTPSLDQQGLVTVVGGPFSAADSEEIRSCRIAIRTFDETFESIHGCKPSRHDRNPIMPVVERYKQLRKRRDR